MAKREEQRHARVLRIIAAWQGSGAVTTGEIAGGAKLSHETTVSTLRDLAAAGRIERLDCGPHRSWRIRQDTENPGQN